MSKNWLEEVKKQMANLVPNGKIIYSEYAENGIIDETSRRQKAIQSIQSRNHKIRTIGIISAENPMGQVASSEYNKNATEDLIKNLKIGHYQYFIVKGMYGSPEISVMVYNISIDDMLKLCYTYNQESMIFIDMTNGDDVSCQYWEGDDHNSKLKLQREEHRFIDATDDNDFYTQISREFKFRIPFFECVKHTISLIEKNSNKYDVDKLINECIDNKYTGKHKYICRCKLYENKIIFNYDKITEHTLNTERNYILTEAQLNNYNWILKHKNWEINNYDKFLEIINKTPSDLKGFLTQHDYKEISQNDWITYTLKGYDVAFALHYIEPGKIDICNLVNNSNLKGIGNLVVQFAKSQGGTQMDNYRGTPTKNDPEGNGKLGNLYRKNGFDKQTWTAKWDPSYQENIPDEWKFNTNKFGEPDVEGLELSKHRQKYDSPDGIYKDKFDKKYGSKFK